MFILLFFPPFFLHSAWVDADGFGQGQVNVSNDPDTSYVPDFVLDASGRPHIAWVDIIAGNGDIYYMYWDGAAWVDADGTGQGDINISNNSGQSWNISLVLDASGNPHIVWSDMTGGNFEVYYLKWNGTAWVDADGAGQGQINVSNDAGDSINPCIFLDALGNPGIAWSNASDEIYYLKWDGVAWVDAGGTGQGGINISNTSGMSRFPSFAMDTAGNPAIAWADNTPGNDEIYFLKWNGAAWVDADGAGQGQVNVSNNPGGSVQPKMALDASGAPHIAWLDFTPGNYEVYYLKWNGAAWVDSDGTGQGSINVSNDPGRSIDQSITLDASGNAHIAWADDRFGPDEICYLYWDGAAWVDADGVGQGDMNVSNNAGYSRCAVVDLGVSGNPRVAWYDNTPGNSDIFYLKYEADPTQTMTATAVPVSTSTPTVTESIAWTVTETITETASATPTLTASETETPSNTMTYTATITETPSATVTITLTLTPQATATVTSVSTAGPALLTIQKSVTGDQPETGADVTYTIAVRNDTAQTVINVAVWDTLPPQLSYTGYQGITAPQVTGNYVSFNYPSLAPGDIAIMRIMARVEYLIDGYPVENRAWCDYNDAYHTAPSRHPAIVSNSSFYPSNIPAIFPNPYSPKTAAGGTLKIHNLVPGSRVKIYTLSAELVYSMTSQTPDEEWNGKNRNGSRVSPGIYYLIIEAPDKNVYMGKIFVVS